jgi:predicted Zn-dependent peptidase
VDLERRRPEQRLYERRRRRFSGNRAGASTCRSILWLEADRLASLRIDESVQDEREVVKEERRMRIENQPYGRLQEIIADQTVTCTPTSTR